MGFYLGLDFGTSGARSSVIDTTETIVFSDKIDFTTSGNWAQTWRETLFSLLDRLPENLKGEIEAIAIDGTSSTVLLCDASGNSIDEPILYNDKRGASVLTEIEAVAPPSSPVLSASSSLAKLLWWRQALQNDISSVPPLIRDPDSLFFLHQADWLSFLLHGKLGVSDYNNALKLGYDVENLCYPDWLWQLDIPFRLPEVIAPGESIAKLTPDIARRYGFSPHCTIKAGTTDSTAAFLATGAKFSGEAVTSLGSTLALKVLSRQRIEDDRYGIYSHRLGDLWLDGGASNTGGAVLKQFFSDAELSTLSQQIPNVETDLNYYPLIRPGERFPINDANLAPKLDPKPDNKVEFLHGLLESIARIEALGYQRLRELGAPSLVRVYTAGGGAKNEAWRNIRQRHLGVEVVNCDRAEAAFGTARLARGLQAIA